jgi:hypothetical protein
MPRLAHQPRPHALAELEVLIARAEAEQGRHRHIVQHGSGADRRCAEIYLELAENRLAQLYCSRKVLLHGKELEEPEEEEAQAQ